ncbi:unnamed protein product [Acanthoscelides obtectus]|uniref:G-protein coupled receptors family 2 profile 2 domain-containing protein n=1 Tax=Acanthoscelides obtectus TaxID=200917 RepID=A0A9P0LYM0_ACAOB|nr:unnamed protein product [Acanthoscelides obtectus]CAK1619976.1 G-protein coupled receptor Mth2 [Acanthoscelides obtectus]
MSFSDNIEASSDPFAIISNRTCSKIYLMNEKRYTFTLKKNGAFSYWQNTSNAFVNETIEDPFSYCIEHSTRANLTGFFFFKCFKEIPYKDKFRHTLWPKILSCVFLGLTILIYLLLKETNNLFGKILMNYCTATLLLFMFLVYAQVNLETNDVHCRTLGYIIIFVSTASFAWLNIMCCDIWLTFGYTRQAVGVHQKRRDCRRLITYMLCGWNLPAFHTLIIYAFSVSRILPEAVHPYIGYRMCFIENRNYAAILFLRFPHLCIQIVNVILFAKTINYCLKVKNEISRTIDVSKFEKKDRFKRNKENLSLILKLSVIMGVTFLFDTMTGFFRMSEMGDLLKYIEIIWDSINCLQGVFIFIIFICKRKIIRELLRKFHFRDRSSSTRTSYSTTRMSTLSTTSRNSKTAISRRST